MFNRRPKPTAAPATSAAHRPVAPTENRSHRGLVDKRPAATQLTRLASIANPPGAAEPLPGKANRTGVPDALKSGIEQLSGQSLDHVRVHRNSAKPAQLNAHAYAQGSEIHLAPGQEKHLPHEAWHVVQQAQGRVKPTLQTRGVAINDSAHLEQEADVMGHRASGINAGPRDGLLPPAAAGRIAQRIVNPELAIALAHFALRVRETGSLTSDRALALRARVAAAPTLAAARTLIDQYVNAWHANLAREAEDGGAHRPAAIASPPPPLPVLPNRVQLAPDTALYHQLVRRVMANHRNRPYATDFFHEQTPLMQLAMRGRDVPQLGLNVLRALFQLEHLFFGYSPAERPQIRITAIEIVTNPVLAARFEQARAAMLVGHPGGVPEQMLYFGHSPAMMQTISQTGHRPDVFRHYFPRGKGHGALGRGAYFTDRIDKAISYSGNAPGTRGMVMMNRVLLGTIHRTPSGTHLRHQHHDSMVRARPGNMVIGGPGRGDVNLGAFDSILGQQQHPSGASAVVAALRTRRGEFDSNEYLVRNADQILPAFIIHYEVVAGVGPQRIRTTFRFMVTLAAGYLLFRLVSMLMSRVSPWR